MVRRLADDVVHRILIRLSASDPIPSITTAVGVAHETVYRMQRNVELWGVPYPPPTVKLGLRRLLLPYQEERLLEFLEDQPTAYLDEIEQFIYDEYNELEVSIGCTRRLLLNSYSSFPRKTLQYSSPSQPLNHLFSSPQSSLY
ncbi:hypothetical protein F5882DRAFT_368716 [Hyaloscypha sp. PMI_1271]|nr:hypothetical protein F5882DRAFT_368716 [Hyaloscypha sp. PMI_1271]